MSKKMNGLWFLLAVILMFVVTGCKTFTDEGRALREAERFAAEDKYDLAVRAASEALVIDPEFVKAMQLLSEFFRKGTFYYNNLISEHQPMAGSRETLGSNGVLMHVDIVASSFSSLKMMNEVVRNSGLERMVDPKKGDVYVCEYTSYTNQQMEWNRRALDHHYDVLTDLINDPDKRAQRSANKHARFIIDQYDPNYRDVVQLEAESKENAMVNVLVVADQDSHGITVQGSGKAWLDGKVNENSHDRLYQLIIDKMVQRLQSDSDVMMYTRFVGASGDQQPIWTDGRINNDAELFNVGNSVGADYILVISSPRKSGRYWRASYDMDESSSPQEIYWMNQDAINTLIRGNVRTKVHEYNVEMGFELDAKMLNLMDGSTQNVAPLTRRSTNRKVNYATIWYDIQNFYESAYKSVVIESYSQLSYTRNLDGKTLLDPELPYVVTYYPMSVEGGQYAQPMDMSNPASFRSATGLNISRSDLESEIQRGLDSFADDCDSEPIFGRMTEEIILDLSEPVIQVLR